MNTPKDKEIERTTLEDLLDCVVCKSVRHLGSDCRLPNVDCTCKCHTTDKSHKQ